MSARFPALGFHVGDDKDLDRMVSTVLAETEGVTRPGGGRTHVCGTSSRAALVVHQDPDGAVACVTPFLSAQTRTVVRVVGVVVNHACPHCSVLLVDAWGPGGVVRIPMATPHFELWVEELVVGSAIIVGLAGVAESVEHVDAGAAPSVVADAAVMDPAAAGAEPMVELCGTVTAHLMRHNDLGRGAFEWAALDCGGLVVEIVSAPGDLARPFKTGDVIAGRFHLSGPIWDLA